MPTARRWGHAAGEKWKGYASGSPRCFTLEARELLDQLAEEYGSRTAVLREGMAAMVKRRGEG